MSREIKKYLFDIEDAIDSIRNYVEGIEGPKQLEADPKTRHAVENRLIVIGEACFKLMKRGVRLPESDSFINRRNTFVHNYDSFSSHAVWSVIIGQLPELKQQILQIRSELK